MLELKQLEVFLFPLDGMLVHRRVTRRIKFAGTHLYTWVKTGTVRESCPRTRTVRSKDERTNPVATAPHIIGSQDKMNCQERDSERRRWITILEDYVTVGGICLMSWSGLETLLFSETFLSRQAADAVLHMSRIECEWENCLFSLISIRFSSCEVRRLTRA